MHAFRWFLAVGLLVLPPVFASRAISDRNRLKAYVLGFLTGVPGAWVYAADNIAGGVVFLVATVTSFVVAGRWDTAQHETWLMGWVLGMFAFLVAP